MPGENEGQELEVQTQVEDEGNPADEGGEQGNLESAIDALTDNGEGVDLPTDKPQSAKMLDFLDTISADGKAAETKPQGEGEQKPAEGEGENAGDKKPEGEQQPEAKTAEQEEAELLEGVKSERGKERIREVFAAKKQLESDMGEFKQLISDTKMTPDQFAQTLEYGRLINSGDEKDLRVALEMIEQERAFIYQKLGVEAPGIDLLQGHDDLKAAVDNMEITREKAVELAKFRKQDQENSQQQRRQQQSQQETAQFQKNVNDAATAMESYLNTRAGEADHPTRMQIITEHFKNPVNLQAFIQTYQPHQWAATVKMMYDNIVVPKAQPTVHSPQPLRSRPALQGNPSSAGTTPIDRIASHMDNMGI